MDYPQALAWLYGTQLFGIKLGLESMGRLCRSLEIDVARPRFIHVAGTNGKGSTCAFAASVARAAGYRTGLFTSPHLVSFAERIRVDDELIPESRAAEILAQIRETVTGWDPHPTFFEITTALALRYFQLLETEIVLLETGMGGRLDATNIVSPAVAVLTPIALDHQRWLGETIVAIAAEKFGILKPGVPAVSAPQPPEIAVPDRVAVVSRPVPDGWTLGLAGPHQRSNAALAVAALEAAGVALSERVIRAGLAAAAWPGRFQRVDGGRMVLDGAHNPAAARALVATWQEAYGGERATIVFGALRDKAVAEVLAILEPVAERFIFTRPESPRSVDPSTLRASPPSEYAGSLKGALALAASYPERQLVTGSLFLVGEALGMVEVGAAAFEVSAQ